MPKTLNEIKKLSAYSEDFEKAVGFIKITQEYTLAVVTAIEKLINAPPPKHTKPNDFEQLAQVAQKYMPYFVSGSFYEALQATANVCYSVAKQEREAQMEAFQRVVTPMKSWLQDDCPRLMKDIKKCYTLKDKMDRSLASAEARKTPERLTKAQEARNKHQLFFERVENEYQFERKAKDEFLAAFTKCEAEISAGTAALKEAHKNSITEESKKEGEKKTEKVILQKSSIKSEKPEEQKISPKEKKVEEEEKTDVQPKKVEEEVASIKVEKPEEQKTDMKLKKEEEVASIHVEKPEK